MKKTLLYPAGLLLLSIIALCSGCAKEGIKDPVTLDKAAGSWGIHGVRYRVFYNSAASIDSTVPRNPNTQHFVRFDGVSSLQYCYNNTAASTGEYAFFGADSIMINVDHTKTRWKINLLTATNFNIESTSTNDPRFPGARVVTYQGFIK